MFFIKPFFETCLIGTMKELSNKTKIPIQTLYWLYYNKTCSIKYSIMSITEFDWYIEVQETRKRVGLA